MLRPFIALILIVPALLLSACGKKGTQDDCGFVQNVYGERVSWKGNLPVKLYLHQSFPAEYVPALQEAIQEWETKTGKDLFEIAGFGVKGSPMAQQDGLNVISWVDDWSKNLSGDQAITAVFYVSDTMKEADMRINGQKTYYMAPAEISALDADSRPIHINSLLKHELGHVLGMKHRDSGDVTAMATTLQQKTERGISDVDREAVQCEY